MSPGITSRNSSPAEHLAVVTIGNFLILTPALRTVMTGICCIQHFSLPGTC